MSGPFERIFADGSPGPQGEHPLRPYPWQRELALAEELPAATDAPTGAGKTEAVVFAWLWRRLLAGDADLAARTPRRLAIALPMRVLVEQTRDRIERILAGLRTAGHLDPERPVRVHTLLGGDAEDDWALRPADEQVLVGTVDMLLSRALNRGYGRGRGSWPLDFGLINTDTLWALDEVQLLDAALATSCQLAAFRVDPTFGAWSAPVGTLWMSATMDRHWLRTVDHEPPPAAAVVSVGPEDEEQGLGIRLNARKRIARVELDPLARGYGAALAELVLERHADARPSPHEPPWLTIALCNTVDRARAVYDALARMTLEPELVLLHSRYRPRDRAAALRRATAAQTEGGGRIVVTTQVIEAGVDLDAAAIVTELSPWASFVQRAGRLNRAGRRESAVLTWIDFPQPAVERLAAPYESDDLNRARSALTELEGAEASPKALRDFAGGRCRDARGLLPAPRRGLVLRRPDLVELFDTDPTLDGDDADVGQFIRLGEDLDVQVAWRSLGGNDPGDPKDLAPARDELCPVPVRDRKELAERGALRRSYARRRWERVSRGGREIVPGEVLLLDRSAGGYTPDRGWDPRQRGSEVEPIEPGSDQPEAESDPADANTEVGKWLTIAEHTDDVVATAGESLARLPLAESDRSALLLAARYHDAGKAHPTFQERLGDVPDPKRLWAKSERRREPRPRTLFRHEVASVLLLLAERGAPETSEAALALYLVGAHHAKLRLVPRMCPPVLEGPSGNGGSCLGVREGDAIPAAGLGEAIDLGGGVSVPALAHSRLDPFRLGGAKGWNWTESALDLLDERGVLGLAYLEALMVAADRLASRREAEDA